MGRFRTDVENLFLTEMVEEDVDFIMMEDSINDIVLANNKGLFDDTSSGNDLLDMDDFEDDLDIF